MSSDCVDKLVWVKCSKKFQTTTYPSKEWYVHDSCNNVTSKWLCQVDDVVLLRHSCRRYYRQRKAFDINYYLFYAYMDTGVFFVAYPCYFIRLFSVFAEVNWRTTDIDKIKPAPVPACTCTHSTFIKINI